MKFLFGGSLNGRVLSGYVLIVLLSVISLSSYMLLQDQQVAMLIVLFSTSIGILTCLIAIYLINSYVIKPVKEIDEAIQKISKGEMVEILTRSGDGEIGNIQQAISSLVKGLQTKSEFAGEIGKGNYEKEFTPLSKYDTIGTALLQMRNNLKSNAEEESKRNWTTAGLAQIGEILRQHYSSSQQLYDQVLTFLVKYLNANQGGLFLLQDVDSSIQLELVSCYAYDRKKYQHKLVAAGEGLVGQAFLEKDTIVLTQIPENYLHITSGLGQANPRFLLIVPLKINETVHGVVELASFQIFEKYQVAFVERIAESIASTIASVKTNEITRKLLEETKFQTEQMRAQEEEMRQNMEELMATQENQNRLQEELKANEEIMKESLQDLRQSKEQLEKKETELIQSNEKSQARANKFREKMEALDVEIESKNSQINVLKKANEVLLEKLSKYENQSIN